MKHKIYFLTSPFLICAFVGTTGFANGLSSRIAARHTQSASSVTTNQGINTNSREYKAQDAVNQGSTGAGVAAATGGVLLGMGIPMVISPILPVKIAGADLIAKAAQEFAQAAQNRKTNQLNQSQRNLLNEKYDSGNNAANRDSQALSEPLNQFQSLLQDRGVDTSRFRDQLANGEFNSIDDVLRAMGEEHSATPEELAQAGALSASRMGEAQGLVRNALPAIDVGMNEVAPMTEPVGESADSSGAYGHTPSTGSLADSAQGEAGNKESGQDHPIIGVSLRGSADGEGNAEKNEGAPSFAFDSSGLLQNVLGFNAEEVGDGAASLIRIALEKIGVSQPNPTQNIFQLAHRNYKGFSKWRKEPRVASSKF